MTRAALISYGFDLMGPFYDIAAYVHRIAGGAKSFDMKIRRNPASGAAPAAALGRSRATAQP